MYSFGEDCKNPTEMFTTNSNFTKWINVFNYISRMRLFSVNPKVLWNSWDSQKQFKILFSILRPEIIKLWFLEDCSCCFFKKQIMENKKNGFFLLWVFKTTYEFCQYVYEVLIILITILLSKIHKMKHNKNLNKISTKKTFKVNIF